MVRPQNRTMNSQPTPLTPYPPDAIIPAPGITVPAVPLAKWTLPPKCKSHCPSVTAYMAVTA